MAMTRLKSSAPAHMARFQAQVELERRRRGLTRADPLLRYRYQPEAYIREKLGWTPWAGDAVMPGQVQVIEAYTRALRAQHERTAYEAEQMTAGELTCWQPGDVIQNRIRIEAGHTTGKTKLSSGLINHFFDTCPPAIIYTFAPTWDQIHDLLWKEIKVDRIDKGLPGRILDLKLDRAPDHFAIGRATDNSGGSGSERVQGQHGPYLMFVLDEAEGIADYVYDAVDSMSSGGIVIVLQLANPRTRTSRFYKARTRPDTVSFRMSCLGHPNVRQGREVVPGAVRRDYVEAMALEHCEQVEAHNEDEHTFELEWRPGVIYRPRPVFMWRVLGIAPANSADNVFVPMGRYEAALGRAPAGDDVTVAQMGVDVARYGHDFGTLYVSHAGRVWRAAQFEQRDTLEYVRRIRTEALALAAAGAKTLSIRVDGGGGFGGGVVDPLVVDTELEKAFTDYQIREVHFNAEPYDGEAYADLVTEMYDLAGERLRVLSVQGVPDALAGDLCERKYRWAIARGNEVKRIEQKDDFKKRMGRSPDDGDGFVLAVAPEYVFRGRIPFQGWDDDD